MLLYQNKVSDNPDAFAQKVQSIGDKLGINPNFLMFIMWYESKFNHKASNGSHFGLIQFSKDILKKMGTTAKGILSMTNVKQLDYVYKYFSLYNSKIKRISDVYFAVFFPAAVGKPLDYVLQSKKLAASKLAAQNPDFDINKDKKITVGEVEQFLISKTPEQLQYLFTSNS